MLEDFHDFVRSCVVRRTAFPVNYYIGETETLVVNCRNNGLCGFLSNAEIHISYLLFLEIGKWKLF